MSVRTRSPASCERGRSGSRSPRYATIHHAIVAPDQAMVVAFVRMAGESRPWGIAWGTVGSTPKIASVPDGRVRDDVAELCAELRRRPARRTYGSTTGRTTPSARTTHAEQFRQVWLPNGQHVAMLHQLSYTYSQTKFGGANQDILRAFGRLAGWMFRDTSRAWAPTRDRREQRAERRLRVPGADVRTAHLGYQLAWLTTPGDRDDRMAAASEAEASDRLADARPRARTRTAQRPRRGVERRPACRRRRVLDGRRRSLPTSDPSSSVGGSSTEAGVPASRRLRPPGESRASTDWSTRRTTSSGTSTSAIELKHNDPSLGPAYVAHPETDFHGSSAASRYLIHAAADEAYVGHLIHDDAELLQEALVGRPGARRHGERRHRHRQRAEPRIPSGWSSSTRRSRTVSARTAGSSRTARRSTRRRSPRSSSVRTR